ncbi:Uu.00g139670.m01.CDS01 [Anthostomella pinea]|uniref:Uu.00g139670.m01.CDS01 n=1 Tax=Anthostomella pinea TaxID=933095 RepID=A0AAI8YIW9_9PEZI|nr:Uu.00g139670.m01.CDS01 [Anthostomella pinea]
MDDDWQEAAFSSRHVHNRVGRSSGGRTERQAAFDVRKAFGTYGHGGASDEEAPTRRSASASQLEIYRLTPSGQGLVGEIRLRGAIEATVVLAGSRKTLRDVVGEMEVPPTSTSSPDASGQEEQGEGEGEESSEEAAESAEDREDSEDVSAEASQQRRSRTFEKNSFRSPKFWLQWRGQVTRPGTSDVVNGDGVGYLVFAGNDCCKFQATISCRVLGWDNVSFGGRKDASRSERDVPVVWAYASPRGLLDDQPSSAW